MHERARKKRTKFMNMLGKQERTGRNRKAYEWKGRRKEGKKDVCARSVPLLMAHKIWQPNSGSISHIPSCTLWRVHAFKGNNAFGDNVDRHVSGYEFGAINLTPVSSTHVLFVALFVLVKDGYRGVRTADFVLIRVVNISKILFFRALKIVRVIVVCGKLVRLLDIGGYHWDPAAEVEVA
ncbi:hypothetical protein POVWA2_023350 [Plasmodium ovale wallikeri]|uniref:Uncharacterized protein n=1 Tax=Plasmodium ovale wallikeri TaxID=864142 RepID=A0A1A8YT20_PLAOA|nr:hypothetical protein POVWA1_023550 [Plasmodium ovale wallikeri]SBT35118.1 hypothetical protein POVWA2_023350 [Plasmodium ovale wallikeri]